MIKARRGTLRVPEYEPFIADHLPRVPDLLQRLSWEHRQIEKLWRDLQRLHARETARAPSRMGGDTEAGVAQVLVQALADHEAAEMGALYPAAAKVMTPEWAETAKAEYAELEAMLDEVDGADPEDEAVFAIFERVFSQVMAHISEEESIVFPAMRVTSPPEDIVNPEGYDFLGLPPGKTMIAVTPGQRQLALGTGRARAKRQMALEAGPSERQADGNGRPEARPTGNGSSTARDNGTHNGRDNGKEQVEAAASGDGDGEPDVDVDVRNPAAADGDDGPDIDLTAAEAEAAEETSGTTKTKTRPKTRARRLLRRR